MDSAVQGQGDSLRSEGGSIPGSGGIAAFALRAPEPSALPVLIAVPHAGRAYPPSLIAARGCWSRRRRGR